VIKDYIEHAEHKALRSEIPTAATTAHAEHHAEMNPFTGFMAVTAACMTSGLAGVYFEMVLKGSKADLWTRNIQLSFFSLIPALMPVLFNGNGGSGGIVGLLVEPFRNFSLWAWATVLTQVFGGLITAIVIKYSDNILKGFATSLSIILSFLASVGLFNYPITPAFVIGSIVVLSATWMYNQPEQKKATAMSGVGGGPTLSRMDVAVPGSPIRQDAPIIGETPKPSRTPSVASLIGLANSITRSSTPTTAQSHGDHLQPSAMPFNMSGNNSARGTPTGYFTPSMSSYPSSATLSSNTSSPNLSQEFGNNHQFTSRHGQTAHTSASTYRPPIYANAANPNGGGGLYIQTHPASLPEYEESIPTSPYTATTSYSSGPGVLRDSPVRERKGSVARAQKPVVDIHAYDKMR